MNFGLAPVKQEGKFYCAYCLQEDCVCPRELSPDNPREKSKPPPANTVEYLITQGLGYCCEAYFWGQYLNLPAPLIAARLGVREDTIRRHKQWYRSGKYSCTLSRNCIPNRWRYK